MTEERRAEYLEALGIVAYRARDASPRIAVPSPKATGVMPSATTAETGTVPTAAANPVLALEGLRPQIDARSVSTPSADSARVVAAVTAPVVAMDLFLQLRVACWQPVAELLVLDSVARGHSPGADRIQLLMNILRALRRLPDRLDSAELIDWPVPTAGADGIGAKVLLEMFLQGRSEKRRFQWLLAMGEAPVRLLAEPMPGTGDDWRLHWGGHRPLASGATALFLPGLGDMLEDPACKVAAWTTLRFLATTASKP